MYMNWLRETSWNSIPLQRLRKYWLLWCSFIVKVFKQIFPNSLTHRNPKGMIFLGRDTQQTMMTNDLFGQRLAKLPQSKHVIWQNNSHVVTFASMSFHMIIILQSSCVVFYAKADDSLLRFPVQCNMNMCSGVLYHEESIILCVHRHEFPFFPHKFQQYIFREFSNECPAPRLFKINYLG